MYEIVVGVRVQCRGRFTAPIADVSAPNHIDVVKQNC